MEESKYTPEETKLLDAIFGADWDKNQYEESLKKSTHRKPIYRTVECTVYRNGKKEQVTGFFHQWGFDVDENADGNLQWSVAIVELPDGTIVNPQVTDVKFIS